MPFIHIMATRSYLPEQANVGNDARQTAVLNMARGLPQIFIDNAQAIGLDPNETPLEGVQVTFGRFHPCSINVPNLGFYVVFTEPRPKLERDTRIITDNLRDLILAATDIPEMGHVRLSLDVFWGNSHGFLRFGEVFASW